MAAAEKSASRQRTPGRARVVSTNKKRRPCILPGLKDRKLAGGYLGSVLEFSPKPTVIASAYGKTLREMRRRKHVIYDALKSAWRIGQKRRDKAGVWVCLAPMTRLALLDLAGICSLKRMSASGEVVKKCSPAQPVKFLTQFHVIHRHRTQIEN